MSPTQDIVRRDFLARSAGILGAAAVAGTLAQNLYAHPGGVTANASGDAYVKIAGKNHFVSVQAWISDAVLKATHADTEAKREALIYRLLHENERYLDIITKGGAHVGPIRLYVDVPHPVSDESVVHAAAAEQSEGTCYHNMICCEWAVKPGKECCVCWSCCDLV